MFSVHTRHTWHMSKIRAALITENPESFPEENTHIAHTSLSFIQVYWYIQWFYVLIMLSSANLLHEFYFTQMIWWTYTFDFIPCSISSSVSVSERIFYSYVFLSAELLSWVLHSKIQLRSAHKLQTNWEPLNTHQPQWPSTYDRFVIVDNITDTISRVLERTNCPNHAIQRFLFLVVPLSRWFLLLFRLIKNIYRRPSITLPATFQ